MNDVILKRFEHPDEVRTFEKGTFELVHVGGMTIGPGNLSAGLEVVGSCGKGSGCQELYGGTCRLGYIGKSDCGNGRWARHRDQGWRSFLHCAGTRQLGGGPGTLCVPPLYGCRRICATKRRKELREQNLLTCVQLRDGSNCKLIPHLQYFPGGEFRSSHPRKYFT